MLVSGVLKKNVFENAHLTAYIYRVTKLQEQE